MTAAKGPAGQAALGKLSSSASQFKANIGSKYLGGGHSTDTTDAPSPSNTAGESTVDQSARPSFGALRGAFASAQNSLASQGMPRPGVSRIDIPVARRKAVCCCPLPRNRLLGCATPSATAQCIQKLR